MVIGVGLAVLCIGGLLVPRIVRYISAKFHSSCEPTNPQKSTLIVTLGFWPGASDTENGRSSVDDGLTRTLAASISESIYEEIANKVSLSNQ